MIKNLILDFGGVLLPLNTSDTDTSFEELGAMPELQEQQSTFHDFETGKISGQEFTQALQPYFFRKAMYPGDIKAAWNAMLGEIPEELIPFLKKLKKDYRLFLLSNTNQYHVDEIRQTAGPFLYNRFISKFEAVYYSHEVGMRKPDTEIFEKILQENDLEPSETYYVDDTKPHIKTAKKLGLKCWHLKPEEEDIFALRKKINSLN